ncbi:sulfotransferase family protein [Ectobacillus panaciterrae]|uniref:sulfotransferase family protein n=1 Tax=Ectobacillus panaciterrae TaxID=363872 RepID=UPI00040FF610|nr:glycosyl transferase group 1 [Ectobacillus panaciterrae]
MSSIANKNSKLFLILSLHRSGSSATAGVLHHLGINMGDHLVGGTPDNPKGHYENSEFVKMNDEILHSVGASWDHPVSWDVIMSSSFPKDEIRSFLTTQIKPIWGLKDPRTLLTFDIWKPYLVEIADITYVFIWRPFESSALSLAHRDKLDLNVATSILTPYYNNFKYYRNQLEKAGQEIVDIHFDDLLNKPEVFVKEINLKLCQDPHHNLDIVKSFLDETLRHF